MKHRIAMGVALLLYPIVAPVHWLRVQYIRWRVKHELTTHRPEDHPGLKRFSDNENVTVKGVMFRVRARYTDPAACLILEPLGSSRKAMLNRLRDLRRDERIERKQLAQIRKALNHRWPRREVQHVD